jgi:hypothetical protein
VGPAAPAPSLPRRSDLLLDFSEDVESPELRNGLRIFRAVNSFLGHR